MKKYQFAPLAIFKPLLLIFVVLFLFISSCKKEPPYIDPNLYDSTPYALVVPAGFPPMESPDFNPLTKKGVELGRRLYYDPILSMNGRSCSTCHLQSKAFSASGLGPNGMAIPAHVNLGWNSNFGWLGTENFLDHVALADLAEGNIFLNANNDSILSRLSRHQTYPGLFKQAFGIDIGEVSLSDRQHYISYALTQFMRIQISANSPYDRFINHEPGSILTESEQNGYVIFFTERGDCFHCHDGTLFTNNGFHNIGLDSDFTGINAGRFSVTGNAADYGKFGVPTLRNIELTAPYMHDNRFLTLEEVVEHYNSGVKNSPSLDPIMTKPGKETGLNLSAQEKADLVAFLKTLTDTEFTSNPALGTPF